MEYKNVFITDLKVVSISFSEIMEWVIVHNFLGLSMSFAKENNSRPQAFSRIVYGNSALLIGLNDSGEAGG